MFTHLTPVKSYESDMKNSQNNAAVIKILENSETVTYALRGITNKIILYILFSFCAACELSAALFFYSSSLGAAFWIALFACIFIAFSFHFFIHHVLKDTAQGFIFLKRNEGSALQRNVYTDVAVSLILLTVAALTVNKFGKQGFANYRSINYNAITATVVHPAITPDMLTNKKGKISGYKLEQLTAYTLAATSDTEKNTQVEKERRAHYDQETVNICDIVGASAFILELIIAFLAYAIVTAKYAAAITHIADQHKKNTENAQTFVQITAPTTNKIAASVPMTERKSIGFEYGTKIADDVPYAMRNTQCVEGKNKILNCAHCDIEFERATTWQKYCGDPCRILANELRTGKKLRIAKKQK